MYSITVQLVDSLLTLSDSVLPPLHVGAMDGLGILVGIGIGIGLGRDGTIFTGRYVR